MIKQRQLTKENILNILKAEQPYLEKEFGVERLALFGSFAKGKPTLKSDVDLVIKLKRRLGFEFFDLIDYLEQKLGRKVDALTSVAIDGIRVKSVAEGIKRSMIDV